MPRRRPELMSPAGHWPQLHAAVEAGADAVYFGLNHFSARAKVGFDVSELPKVMQTLHRRGVKGFVTFNTLVFDHELELAESAIREIISAGADSIIVQDIGIAKLIHELAPEFPIHGSTQMSVTSAEGAELARGFGCSRVVLGRELSLSDIKLIASQSDMELEVFVHGALCVSYSGQCFSSEAWGGRSANRGQCAQACRLSYDLIVDGERRDLDAARYLLSPGDLYALEQIPELTEIGVACVKIEGRYKDADYVAVTTKAYRQAIDAAWNCEPVEMSREARQDIEQIYSRGLGPFFISGTNHQTVVVGRAPRHRGVRLGVVTKVFPDSVTVKTELGVHRGEGVVFDAADRRSPEIQEQGGFVFDVQPAREGEVRLFFDHEKLQLDDIEAGDVVWRTFDPQLTRRLKPIVQANDPQFTRPLAFQLFAHVGQPPRIVAQYSPELTAVFVDQENVAAARSLATTEKQIRQQLERLGSTPYHLGSLELDVSSDAFLPASTLNRLRRTVVERLIENQSTAKSVSIGASRVTRELNELAAIRSQVPASSIQGGRIHLLVRTPEQLNAAIAFHPESITLDYLELYGLRPAVERIRNAGITPRVASPRILKPSEQKVIQFLLSLECCVLVRSGGLLQELVKIPAEDRPVLIGDFSLNVANALTADAMLLTGLSQITPTHDLNAAQITDLTSRIPPARMEVVVYHHLPVFHTKHCLFCRFLSTGTDNTNCGHPCEKHRLAVRDGQNREHAVLADVGCRNTIFGAEIQTASRFMNDFVQAGLGDFRMEFVHQDEFATGAAAAALREFLELRITADELDQRFRETGPSGTTQGSLFVPKDFRKLFQIGQKLGLVIEPTK